MAMNSLHFIPPQVIYLRFFKGLKRLSLGLQKCEEAFNS